MQLQGCCMPLGSLDGPEPSLTPCTSWNRQQQYCNITVDGDDPSPSLPEAAAPCPPTSTYVPTAIRRRSVYRYLATHGYNISMVHLVDQIASPYPKKLFEARTSAALDEWPTPTEYYYNIREGTLPTHALHNNAVLPVNHKYMPHTLLNDVPCCATPTLCIARSCYTMPHYAVVCKLISARPAPFAMPSQGSAAVQTALRITKSFSLYLDACHDHVSIHCCFSSY